MEVTVVVGDSEPIESGMLENFCAGNDECAA